MAIFDEEPRRKSARSHEIGQDLALLSVAELEERVAALKAEIQRLEAEIGAKGSSRNAAESLFRMK